MMALFNACFLIFSCRLDVFRNIPAHLISTITSAQLPKKRQFPLKPKEKRKKKRHRHVRLENKNTIWESSFPYTLHLLWLRLAQGFRFCLFSSGYMGDRVTRGRSRTFFFFFFTVRFQREYSMKNRTRDDLGWFQHRHCRLLPLFPRPRSTHRTPASILVI